MCFIIYCYFQNETFKPQMEEKEADALEVAAQAHEAR